MLSKKSFDTHSKEQGINRGNAGTALTGAPNRRAYIFSLVPGTDISSGSGTKPFPVAGSCRMHRNSGAMADRLAQYRTRRVVHDQGHVEFAAVSRDLANRENRELALLRRRPWLLMDSPDQRGCVKTGSQGNLG
jgi:hypothetical protein